MNIAIGYKLLRFNEVIGTYTSEVSARMAMYDHHYKHNDAYLCQYSIVIV